MIPPCSSYGWTHSLAGGLASLGARQPGGKPCWVRLPIINEMQGRRAIRCRKSPGPECRAIQVAQPEARLQGAPLPHSDPVRNSFAIHLATRLNNPGATLPCKAITKNGTRADKGSGGS